MPPLTFTSPLEAPPSGVTADPYALFPAGKKFIVLVDNSSKRPSSQTAIKKESAPIELSRTGGGGIRKESQSRITIDVSDSDDDEFKLGPRPAVSYTKEQLSQKKRKLADGQGRSPDGSDGQESLGSAVHKLKLEETTQRRTLEGRQTPATDKTPATLKRKISQVESPQQKPVPTKVQALSAEVETSSAESEKSTNAPVTDAAKLLRIQKTKAFLDSLPPDFGAAYQARHQMQKINKKITLKGPSALADNDIATVRRLIYNISFLDFNGKKPDGQDKKALMEKMELQKAIKLMMNVEKFGDMIADPAKELHERWEKGDFGPCQLKSLSAENDFEESDDENDDDAPIAAGDGAVSREKWSPLMKHLMRGILTAYGKNQRIVHRLDPEYPDRHRADVFGYNGLKVGEWWPYQLCALRDGAHGLKQGGIYGNIKQGAFSIVSAVDSTHVDRDAGETLQYAGTTKPSKEDDDGSTFRLTNGTKMLCKSGTNHTPVRVLRKGPRKQGGWQPRIGLRYDGLYHVDSWQFVRGEDGANDYILFTLTRLPDQPKLSDPRIVNRPTKEEYKAFERLREY